MKDDEVEMGFGLEKLPIGKVDLLGRGSSKLVRQEQLRTFKCNGQKHSSRAFNVCLARHGPDDDELLDGLVSLFSHQLIFVLI